MLEEIRKEIPEIVCVKDNFGGDFFFIPPEIMSKRKSWNLLLKRGFQVMPNKQFLKKDKIYAYNNHLRNCLTITWEK